MRSSGKSSALAQNQSSSYLLKAVREGAAAAKCQQSKEDNLSVVEYLDGSEHCRNA